MPSHLTSSAKIARWRWHSSQRQRETSAMSRVSDHIVKGGSADCRCEDEDS